MQLLCAWSLAGLKFSSYSLPFSIVSGTLRSNLDPFNLQEDATLWDALKRSHLVELNKVHQAPQSEGSVPSETDSPVNRFTLDSIIEDEGGNLSVGQVSSRFLLILFYFILFIRG